MKTSSPLVWFITGTAQGFGQELVREALQRGDSVIATSRTPEKIKKLFPEAGEKLLSLKMDLTSSQAITATVAQGISHFGHIDILINNAGYGLLGAIEEASDEEIFDQFQINFFAITRTIKAVLPHFRKQGSGHIVNMSSIAGLRSWTGWGIYTATKFAVEGLSETLAEEIAPFGIGVTIIEPGGFRTNFFGTPTKVTAQTIKEYANTDADQREGRKAYHGHQPGNPARGAEAIIKAVTSEHPPLRLLLGSDAHQMAHEKIKSHLEEIKQWEDHTLSTDFD